MPKAAYAERIVEIPEKVTAKVKDGVVTIKGPKVELKRDFSETGINIALKDKNVVVSYHFPRKWEYQMVGTIHSHIKNMVIGVIQGYEYTMEIVSTHFPASIDVKGREVYVKNLYGERAPRIVPIVGDKTKVQKRGEQVVVSGPDKENVGQTAANIQEICRLRGKRRKDPLLFHDGIYVSNKK